MKSLTYVGTCTAGVEIATPLFSAYCAHGGSVDVPDDIADSLLEQSSNWIITKPKNSNTKEAAE